MGTIRNGADTPLNQRSGSLPDVGVALMDWFQPMTFTTLVKTTVGFQAVETPTAVTFRGVIQPLQGRRLELKPEGQRAWTWLLMHSEPTLKLEVDSIVTWNGVKTRVMSQKDYTIYGYIEYELVQDWT
jgi:hypothetical protein